VKGEAGGGKAAGGAGKPDGIPIAGGGNWGASIVACGTGFPGKIGGGGVPVTIESTCDMIVW
jgi:hypothetical protein